MSHLDGEWSVFDDLPIDLYSLIFSFLGDVEDCNQSDSNNSSCARDLASIMRVCRHWNYVVKECCPLLWRRLSWRMVPMSSDMRKDPSTLVKMLQLPTFSTNVREINLVRPGRGILFLLLLSSDDLTTILSYTPNLTILQVKITLVDDDTLDKITSRCPNLKQMVLLSEHAQFSVESHFYYNLSVFESHIVRFLKKHGPTLLDLNLQIFLCVNSTIFEAIADNCPLLCSLKVRLAAVHDQVDEATLAKLFKKCPNLSEFVVESDFRTDFKYECIDAMVTNSSSLKSLRISNLPMTSTAFIHLQRLSKPLKILHFICPNLTTSWLFHNPLFWSQIEDLDISKSMVSDHGLDIIAAQCNSIKYLYINQCLSITARGLDSITRANPQITKIGVCQCLISDEWLAVLGRNCPALQFFMTNSKGLPVSISNSGLLQMVSYNPETATHVNQIRYCPDILRMDLTSQTSLTDAALQMIVQYCPNLQFLKLTHCAITNLGIQYLSEGCPDLHVLDIWGITDITDTAFASISKGNFAPNLWLLNASGNKITNDGVALLDASCPALGRITLSRNGSVKNRVKANVFIR
ncbi:hypothetical protein PROFUN_09610 [Planoprotostelium fungivorum]|uniref:Uncharacterized protein n=1 Tax=Planoprotostelium fungivorum TaxID=1890364 RepID=A0A2P6MNV1_9EUKA|nr:hypothetical protein PROFUN_09610 [Planoprotostelium fungivorum]